MLTIIFSLFVSASFSACKYEIEAKGVDVIWTAFKTPKKVGVKGEFKELGIKKEYKGESLESIFTGVKFDIDTSSTWTRNAGRDAKIVKYFFQPMIGGLSIKGSITEFDEDEMVLKLKMNKVEQVVPMSVKVDDKKVVANGVIDVLDFSLANSLKGINQACYDLHQGKTWNDVEIQLVAYYEKDCD